MTLVTKLGIGNSQNVVLNHPKGRILDTPLFFQIYARNLTKKNVKKISKYLARLGTYWTLPELSATRIMENYGVCAAQRPSHYGDLDYNFFKLKILILVHLMYLSFFEATVVQTYVLVS
jgi:hypothetical protein